jgi:ribonuclease HII
MRQFDEQFAGIVIGVDEAGRGPLAGAVTAAAVHIPPYVQIEGLRDSKKLSLNKRLVFYDIITKQCIYGVGTASVEEIDKLNILQASMLAMRRAIKECLTSLQKTSLISILVDGNCSPNANDNNIHTIIKGDDKSAAIAAASIIAKVTRDKMMDELHKQFPYYDWHKNAGYPTRAHKKAIEVHGISPHHRLSFNRSL